MLSTIPVTQLYKPAKIHKHCTGFLLYVYFCCAAPTAPQLLCAGNSLLKSKQGILVLDRSHVQVILVLCLCAGKCMLTCAKLKEIWCLFFDGESTPCVT